LVANIDLSPSSPYLTIIVFLDIRNNGYQQVKIKQKMEKLLLDQKRNCYKSKV